MKKEPFLIVLYPPPPSYKEERLDFAKQLVEKLKEATGEMPTLVTPDKDFFCMLVEGTIGAISGALHHARDNQTRYLVVRIQEPCSEFGLAKAAVWIRNHCRE
jgi:hypothetical protein